MDGNAASEVFEMEEPTLVEGLKNSKYHADRGRVSKSMLSDLLDCPREYEALWVREPPLERPAKKDSAEKRIGSAAHIGALEPAKLEQYVAVIPPEVLAKDGARKGKDWDDWAFERQCEDPDLLLLTESEYSRAMAMVVEIYAKLAGELAAPGPVEPSLFWNDPVTGLRCKCRPDKLLVLPDRVVVLDLKTTYDSGPVAFSKTASNFRYPLQHAHYRAGVQAVFPDHEIDFVFWACSGNKADTLVPVCRSFDLSPVDQDRADFQRRAALDDLAYRYEHNDWRADGETRTLTLDIKPWAWT